MTPKAPIVVALSGGVDSATAAAILVERGENVIGITMRLYNAAGTSASVGGRCCGPRDIEDARQVCDHLGIPFYVVDFEREFTEAVVDDFVDAYLKAETPNPCVRCNQSIKFTPLLNRARALGADRLATGHYARIEREPDGVALRRGVDIGKDQSYFLFSMPIAELASIDFPLGGYTKEEVRAHADRLNLPNAKKAESQEICFVPDGDYAGFVEKAAKRRGLSLPIAGEVVDAAGNVVGHHNGTHHFTLGQRRGLGNLKTKHIDDGGPVYVVGIDQARNRVVVGPKIEATTGAINVRDVRWFTKPPVSPIEVGVQIRHRSEPIVATVTDAPSVAGANVEFLGEHPIAAAGQAAVFYDGDRVLGGGWIAPTGA